jgi:short-subunit dehydrogenase
MSMIAVNVETPTRILKLFLPDMIRRGSGKVLNVSSTAAVMPGPLQAVYYATRHMSPVGLMRCGVNFRAQASP